LVQAAPLLVVISIAIFALLQLVPGGPLAVFSQNPSMTSEDLERLRRQYGLDRPLPVQYATWVTDWVTGDWGYSFSNRQPVIDLIVERLGNTLTLMIATTVLTLAIAIPVAMLSAYKQYSWFDHLATLFAFAGISLPTFWFGFVVIIVFGAELGWLPMGGMRTLGAEGFDLWDRVEHLILPATTLAVLSAGSQVRYLRAYILDTIRSDYVRTAYAKGLRSRTVMGRHVFKNAASPVVTNFASDIPDLFTGALITETIFSWPGMGRLYWEAAVNRDYAVLMSVLTVSAVLVVLSYLLADVLYGVLDPRIRYNS
jgi:peptide/nickel transport system permease protein